MRYFTIILVHTEANSLGAAQAMSAHIAQRHDFTITLTVSEKELSELVKKRIDERLAEKADGIPHRIGD